MECKYKGIEVVVDLTHSDGLHKGLECIELVNGYLEHYLFLKPIVLVLKNFLKIHKLNDPYTGGLSSYAILLMVVAYF
jgi:non-canonical poly(A) RNA polymerase PAPD5/7